jgi:hypothetical protein
MIMKRIISGKIFFLLAGLAFATGCSTMDDVVGGTGKVQVSLQGISEGSEESLTKAQALPDTVNLPVKDGLGLLCTLAPDPSSLTRTTSTMTSGYKYRMVAYKHGTTTVAGTQIYTVGSNEGLPGAISLSPGYYDFAFYSFNNVNDPGDPNSSGNVAVPAGVDLLYFMASNVQVTAENITSIQVTFAHKFSAVKVVANSIGVGPSLNSVAATLGVSYPATLAAPTGGLTAGTGGTSAVSWSDASSAIRTSDTAPIYTNGATSITVNFPAGSVNIGGTTNSAAKSVTFTKTLVAGTRYTLNVRFVKCALQLSKTSSMIFMCHNLGADYTADPFTPSWKINGAYWQWGNKNYSVGNPVDASGVSPAYTWNENNYNTASTGTAWNLGTEAAPVKNTTYDPCPTGFRVPTYAEAIKLVGGVAINLSGGAWPGTGIVGTTNFSTGRGYYDATTGTVMTLFLPMAGDIYFQPTPGSLHERGTSCVLWTSRMYETPSWQSAYIFMTGSTPGGMGYHPKTIGHTIRCIAE